MSRWDSALWDIDRWPALTIQDLLQQAPSTSHGYPLGVGDWRVCIEMLLPAQTQGLWGFAEWDEQEWNTYAWYDITSDVRGCEWTRGSDEYLGRPRIGQAFLTLDSQDEKWSPWNPNPPVGGAGFFGPGTIIRIGAHSASDTRANGWLPQYCGIVDQWSPTYVDQAGDLFVDITLFETLRDLSSIDDNALPSVVGNGDTAAQRYARLLDAAGWKYGFVLESQNLAPGPGLISTDMANNRLSECYLTADSVDSQFRTDRRGNALLTSEYFGNSALNLTVWPIAYWSKFVFDVHEIPYLCFDSTAESYYEGDRLFVAYDVDSFKSSNDDSAIANDVRFAKVGGTVQVHEQNASISRYGRRTYTRYDLLNQDDAFIALYALYTSIRRGLNTLRVDALTVSASERDDDTYLACIAADIGVPTIVYPPSTDSYPKPQIVGSIANMTHRVLPNFPGKPQWTITFGFDTRLVGSLPGAQLPSTQP